jgi:hypothetical protein
VGLVALAAFGWFLLILNSLTILLTTVVILQPHTNLVDCGDHIVP